MLNIDATNTRKRTNLNVTKSSRTKYGSTGYDLLPAEIDPGFVCLCSGRWNGKETCCIGRRDYCLLVAFVCFFAVSPEFG